MHPPARAVNVDYYGVMHHAVHDGGGDDGISQVVAEFLEGDVGGDQRGALAVPAVDDFEEERGVPGVVLFQPVEPYFIDQENVRSGIMFEPLVQAAIEDGACLFFPFSELTSWQGPYQERRKSI